MPWDTTNRWKKISFSLKKFGPSYNPVHEAPRAAGAYSAGRVLARAVTSTYRTGEIVRFFFVRVRCLVCFTLPASGYEDVRSCRGRVTWGWGSLRLFSRRACTRSLSVFSFFTSLPLSYGTLVYTYISSSIPILSALCNNIQNKGKRREMGNMMDVNVIRH